MLQALSGARIFTGDRFLDGHAVLIEGGRIADVLPTTQLPTDVTRQDLGGGLLAPGFLDVQINGAGGVLFNDTPTSAGMAAIAAAVRPTGSTGLLPTFITDRPERRALAVEAFRAAAGTPGILGIHLEGPFLSRARKGAHDPALIVPMTDADVDAILAVGPEVGTVLVTVAAENATPSQIRRLADAGVIVSLGHSDASYDVARAAADAGARGVTHLFNAMSQLGHRAPGVVGAALDHGGLWGGIIADGHHVDPAVLRIAIRAKRGPGRLFLISDAMPPVGVPGNSFTLSGRHVTRRDGKLLLDDGTLAGADLTMDRALRFAVETLEVSLGEALRMASLYPAEFLRRDRDRGRIARGFQADLVHLDDAMMVGQTWIAGM